MSDSLIKSMNYQPLEYIEIVLNEPIDKKQHIYFLTNPHLLNCFVHLSDTKYLYYDPQAYVSLEFYLKHHSITKKEIKFWITSLINYLETQQEGYVLLKLDQVFIDEETIELKLCVIPKSYPQEIEKDLVSFVLALYQEMNYEDDDEWISQLYLLVKQRPFRLGLFKQFITSKKTKSWLSFFRKQDEELSNFFKMIQVQESQVSYGLQTVPFETQILMAGFQYGYFLDPYQHKVLITNSKWVVGRQKDCDYVLNFPEVSKQHCEIIVENGACFILDLGSTNGTKLNGERLVSNTKFPLKDKDEILIAEHLLTYYE